MPHQYTECPKCSAIWSMEEIDWQQCDACGWPLNDQSDDEFDTEIDDETMD